eukprot:10340534-Prorocentrum_lima.AAC.1
MAPVVFSTSCKLSQGGCCDEGYPHQLLCHCFNDLFQAIVGFFLLRNYPSSPCFLMPTMPVLPTLSLS